MSFSSWSVEGEPFEEARWHRVVAASAMVGRVMWGPIAPLDGEGIFARFMAEKGGGMHRIAVATPRFDAAVAAPAKQGADFVLSGTVSGTRVAYLSTDRDLGVLREDFDSMPSAERE